LKGAADSQKEALIGGEESGEEPTEAGFILKSFQAMRDLGKTFGVMSEALDGASTELGLPSFFWLLVSSGLLITFAVVIYTWLRGTG
jgi:hypothetical protein